MKKPANHDFFKCTTCGHVSSRQAFTRGALGGHAAQALRRHMVGKGNGPGGAGIVWTRRSMKREELEHVGRAVAKAAETVAALLDDDGLTVIAPESVLATIDDVDELAEVTDGWLEDARRELEYRLKVIEDEYQRRGDARGRR
jgi:hypothetical protein